MILSIWNLSAHSDFTTFRFQRHHRIVTQKTGSMPKLPDEQFARRDFISPIEIDIDEKLSELPKVHIAPHKCLSEIVNVVKTREIHRNCFADT